MALATPASILWKSATSGGSCRDGWNEGRHEGVRGELPGAAIAGRDREAQQWEGCRQSCASRARVSCFMGGNKREEARKALEAALGEKKDAFSKWDEEIKKREEGGGGGKGRGRGWGSGGGGGGGGGGDSSGGGLPAIPSNSWDDAKQMVLAFLGLAALYLVLTQGKSILAVSVNSALYVLRGFKKTGSSSSSSSSGRQPAMSSPIGDGPGPAESSVISKWGRD